MKDKTKLAAADSKSREVNSAASPSPNSPLPASSLLFLAIWLILLLAGRSAMFNDPGTFWHVAAGHKMLAAGQLIRTDSFSFTVAGRPWIDDQWLAEIGMAAVHRAAGWDGLLLLTATLLAGVYAWIGARLLRGGLHFLPAMLLLAITMLAGSPQFHIRPLVVTIVLLGVTFALLVDVEAGTRRFCRLWLLVPVFIFWANIHGGVLAGLGTVALWLAGSCIVDRSLKCFVKTLLLLAALALTTLCNPYGVHLHWEWWETLAMPLPSLIVEHGRLNPLEPIGAAAVAILAVYLVTLFGVFPKRPRVVWLLPLVWFALALLRVRNAPLFAITAAIAMIDILPHSRVGAWLVRRDLLFAPRPPAGWRAIVLPAIFVATAVAVQFAGIQMPLIGRDWAKFPTSRWPMELLPSLDVIAEDVKSADLDAPERRIFNDMNFGGFLIYFEPDLRVFIDDRCSVYGGRFLTDYDSARCDDPAQIERWRRQYGFRHALVIADGRFDRYLAGSADWELVARTSAAALYRHR